MLNLKKFYSDELLQLALILSLLRVDPDSYLGLDIQTIGVGSLDLNNGSGWHTDSHTIVHRPAFVHPKNLDSILLNYERDLFEDLNALGRYNRINTAHNDIHAYLLNIDDKAGPSAAVNNATDDARNATSPDPPQPSQTTDESFGAAELTQEDMDLIEVLWKQDVDLGFTLVDPIKNSATTSKKESEDDLEKLKALEAINHADEKEPKIKEEPTKEEDPWAGIPYTVDLETGEYILSTASASSPSSESPDAAQASSSSSSQDEDQEQQPQQQQQQQQQQPLLGEASLGLVGLGDEDSLGLHDSLGLEDDFASDLLADNCLLDDCADGFLSNDSLGLPDGFNLEEALQLVGLDEVELEKKPEVKEKTKPDSDGARSDSRASNSENEDDTLKGSEANMNVIHPQYHHPHARSFQRGMPLVRPMGMEHHQRWPDMFIGASEPFAHPGAVNPLHQSHLNYTVHHPHHHHQAYGDVSAPPPRQVLMSNATIPPPVGDLNSTGTYHNTGNLGSAVATSMNLTNNGEALSADGVTPFKPEPSDMMSSYYPNPSNDTVNQTDIPFSFLDDQIWPEDAFGVGFNNVSDGMTYVGGTASGGTASSAAAAAAATAVGPTTTMVAPGSTTSPNDDGRMETSSDSAVSSMGSERVPSLSDGGEWMETGSNSSHTQADSHYSMDYTGKYRMPYDCGYSLPPGAGRGQPRNSCQSAVERAGLAPVAQKKHHMFGKRCFQDQQGPMTPGAAAAAAAAPSKYDYDAAQNVAAAGPPGQAYSGPIEGAAGPQPEIKYSCSVDFNRHQSARSSLEHVHHNHTYNLPPESSGALQRPVSRDKKARKSEADEHMTRDEKRARALNVPISVNDIINLPMDEFNERLSKYDLNDSQLGLIRDIRRRGKNKVAAQNCRKRKLDQINSLSDEVREMRTRKMRLKNDREYMLQEVARVKEKFGQLYRHILHSLRDPAGRPYDPRDYSLQLSAEGNVVLVPKSNQSTHYGFPMKKPDHHQQHHHQHKE